MKIAVVAPGGPIDKTVATRVMDVARAGFAPAGLDLVFHPQCFLSSGHFAGSDADRRAAFLEVANAPDIDCVWFAKGGYGACRLTQDLIGDLQAPARAKTYLGYSDTGFLLALLYNAGIGRPVHGPMAVDIRRDGGETAIRRALEFLVSGGRDALEPSVERGTPRAAFNITVLSNLLGTSLEPDLTDHILMLEDVGEYHYQLDRSLFHIMSSPTIRKVKGVRLGRCSQIPQNDPPFGQSVEEILTYWCKVTGVAYLGGADIGHDRDNKIVPFGSGLGFGTPEVTGKAMPRPQTAG